MTHLDKATLEWVVKWHKKEAEKLTRLDDGENGFFHEAFAHSESAAHFRKMIEEIKV